MRKDYTFKSQDFLPFIYNSEINEIIRNYQNMLKIASQFILSFLGSKNYYLELLSEKTGEIEFRATANSKNLILIILNERLIIKNENQENTFFTDWTDRQYFARLEKYKIKEKDRTITQILDAHQIKIEIEIENRIYSFIIPYDIDYYLDPHCFNTINKNTTIIDLKRLYMRRFFENQNVYEKQCLTHISVKEITEENKIILVDELIIKEGFVERYTLSSISNNLIIRISGVPNGTNEIHILNYRTETNIDFSDEINKLYERSRRINIE